MATISFISQGGSNYSVNNMGGSGLGFFGTGGFGQSVAVGSYQDTTFITNGNGTTQGPQVNNVKYISANTGQLPGGTNVNLTSLPNYQSTLNVRFTHNSAVRVQNVYLYIYDRVSTSNPASGVTTAVANIIHPDTNQTATGSGNTTWQFPAGTGYLILSQLANGNSFSPGMSGLGTGGGGTTDTQHDFYVAMSASPNSIGSKTSFGTYIYLEYL